MQTMLGLKDFMELLLLRKSSDKVKIRLGYKAASPAVEDFVNSSKMIENQENVKSRLDKGYHAVPLPYTGSYIPPKPNLMFIDEQVKSKSVDVVSNVSSSDVKTVESKVESVDVKNQDGNGRISVKGEIKNGTLDFDDMYFCKELNVDLKSVVPTGGLTCLFAKATTDESNLWHRRLGHINYKTMNKLNGVAERKNRTLIEAARTIKAMRLFNKRNRIVEETLNIRFLENTPNVKGTRPDWLFDIDSLTISMNYVPVDSEVDAGKKATEVHESQVLDNGGHDDQVTRSEFEGLLQQERQTEHINSTNSFNTVSLPVNTAGPSFVNAASPSPINAAGTLSSTNAFEEHPVERFSPFKNAFTLPHVPIVTPINDTGIFGNTYDDKVVEEDVDMNNVVSSYTIPDAPLTKFLKDHSKDEKPVQALKDPSWVEAMQDELLQFKLLNVWTLVDLPKYKWAIGTKWVFRNKKDEIGIVIKNKARLVAQGHTQEKPSEFEEFEQIIDFLNAKPIRYALTVNPIVYASCVKQLWTTAKVKMVNGQEQILALFDKQKYIFDHMVKRLEEGVKFLMFPRFLQVFLDKQVKGMEKHKAIYIISSHTKKIFANMRRQGQGFSGNVTPLFETMMVNAQEEVGEGSGLHTDSHHTPTDT
nr:putative ribonuclease H-like domain-containing protein [Tanacetum cinerariifolium]